MYTALKTFQLSYALLTLLVSWIFTTLPKTMKHLAFTKPLHRVHIDGHMATAWTPYAFYLGGDLSHCGVNAFQLFNGKDGWKIIRITDTRRREGCEESEESAD